MFIGIYSLKNTVAGILQNGTQEQRDDFIKELRFVYLAAISFNPPAKYKSFDDVVAELKAIPVSFKTISDGFGSEWSITCPMCKQDTMHIVRPGKVQCRNCG